MTDAIWDVNFHLTGVPGATPEDRMAKIIAYADRMGIERACVYMGMSWTHHPTPARFRQENDEVLRAVRCYPDRLFGFAYVNAEHVQASLEEINRCVRDGPMLGVKLCYAKNYQAPEYDPIIERAATLKVPVYLHTWIKLNGSTYPGESTPEDLVVLARRHTDVPLICAHTGGTWELGIRSIRDVAWVYADPSGWDPTAGFMEMAVRELGPERIVYGTDAAGRSMSSQLAKVYGADLSDRDRRLILGGNLRRLLTPILNAKGIKV